MHLDDTPDNFPNFIDTLTKAIKANRYDSILNSTEEFIQKEFFEKRNNFKEITDNPELMEKIINIINSNIYQENYTHIKNTKLFTNNKFHYTYNPKIFNFYVAFFGKFVISRRVASNIFLYHLNPDVLPQFEPIFNLTPHENMDFKIRLKKYFDHDKYGALNKLFYAAMLVQKSPYDSLFHDLYFDSEKLLQHYNIMALNDKYELNEIRYLIKNFHQKIKNIIEINPSLNQTNNLRKKESYQNIKASYDIMKTLKYLFLT